MERFVLLCLLAAATTAFPLEKQQVNRPTGKPYGVVVYWGQNSAGSKYGPAGYEKPLNETCMQHYEVVIMAFLDVFFSPANKDNLPSINLAYHCTTPYSTDYPALLRCPTVAQHIKECQSKGKKVTMSLGGASGAYSFTSDSEAIQFANTIWGMFLGGNSSGLPRPFGDTILDGVDLDIEGGPSTGYATFVQQIRALEMKSGQQKYYISAAPQCPEPDAYLGPQPGKALGDAGNDFDFLNIQFYNNYCNYKPADPKFFFQSWYAWSNWTAGLTSGPKLYIGLLAQPSGNGYVDPKDLNQLFLSVSSQQTFSGAMIWDASWAQNDVVSNVPYNEYVYQALQNISSF